MNANKEYIDGNNTYLKALPVLFGVVSTINAIQLDENFVGRTTNLQVGIMTRTDMTNEAVFDLYFPDQFSLPKSSATSQMCDVTLGSKRQIPCTIFTYPSGYIQKVTILQACPSTCSA